MTDEEFQQMVNRGNQGASPSPQVNQFSSHPGNGAGPGPVPYMAQGYGGPTPAAPQVQPGFTPPPQFGGGQQTPYQGGGISGGGTSNKPRFNSSLKLPLVVGQSRKDGRFYLRYSLAGSIEIDQQAFQHVTGTGQGIGEFQVGTLTVWPPFNKNSNRG